MAGLDKKIRTMPGDIGKAPKMGISETPPRKISPKIFLAIFLFIVMAGGGWYVYKNFLFPEPPKPVDEDVPKKFINAQERIIKLASDSKISSAINAIPKLPDGSFEILFFSRDENGARHFLTRLEFFLASGLHIPQKLFSSINNYNFGVLGWDGKNYPFLVFEISSPEEAREGILAWEKNMPKELSGIFHNSKNIGASGETSFSDRVIKNQTARISDSSGSQVIYSLYNQKLLVITPSQEAFAAIISRYAVFPPN